MTCNDKELIEEFEIAQLKCMFLEAEIKSRGIVYDYKVWREVMK